MTAPDAPIPSSVVIGIKRVRDSGLPLPAYQSAGAAGMDLMADVTESVTLRPGERAGVRTGIAIEVPRGFEAQIRPRSGLALRYGVTLLNTPGTIDADYRGEIVVILVNLGAEDFVVRSGDRIAQMIIAPLVRATWQEKAELSPTARGEGGFGHTGS